MQMNEKVLTALEVLKDCAENEFELHRINVLIRDLTEPPKVEVVDDTHQSFNGNIFYKNQSGHFNANYAIHRAIWFYYYGAIPINYEIHHKDSNKANNDISNLQLLTKSEHKSLHNKEVIPKKCICENCGKEFFTTNTGLTKFCSKKCFNENYKKSEENKEIRECVICGKKFKVFKYSVAKCCSLSCISELALKSLHKTPKVFLEKTCPVCGKIFRTKRNATFCSKKCYISHKKLQSEKNTLEKVCPVCGKIFYVKPYLKDRIYCSTNCANKVSLPFANQKKNLNQRNNILKLINDVMS